MMYSTKITKAEKAINLADNVPFIDVSFNIVDEDGKVVAERKLGFPMDATEEQIRADVENNAVMYGKDHESAELAEKKREEEKAADETISNLVKE